MAELALAAWTQRFGSRQVEIARGEQEPFDTGRRLGGGGIGIVHETTLDGISLALKRTYPRRLTSHQLNEVKILGRISGKKRHQHVVELIGSSIHRQQGFYELGLLIWPVAQLNLADFLEDVEFLNNWIVRECMGEDQGPLDEVNSIMEILVELQEDGTQLCTNRTDSSTRLRLLHTSQNRICTSFVCITSAVSWIHNQEIRHEDIKPSQILLSKKGLWITDFGWSRDVSDMTNSGTSGGDQITVKYHAPERAEMRRCGKPEDVFALGCVFLEMAYRLEGAHDRYQFIRSWDMPWKQETWAFQANLSDSRWLEFKTDSYSRLGLLQILISKMLSYVPEGRPTISEVLEALSFQPFLESYTNHDDGLNIFFASCCTPSAGTCTTNFMNEKSYSAQPHTDGRVFDFVPALVGNMTYPDLPNVHVLPATPPRLIEAPNNTSPGAGTGFPSISHRAVINPQWQDDSRTPYLAKDMRRFASTASPSPLRRTFMNISKAVHEVGPATIYNNVQSIHSQGNDTQALVADTSIDKDKSNKNAHTIPDITPEPSQKNRLDYYSTLDEDIYNDDKFDENGYSVYGYNRDCYDRHGIHISVLGKYGSNEESHSQYRSVSGGHDGNDVNGTTLSGYYREGFDKSGFDRKVYNWGGSNRLGYNKEGRHKANYDDLVLDGHGFNLARRNKDGHDRSGYGEDGFSDNSYNKQGYN